MLTIFMYHRILPEAHPEAISVEQFEKQLDYLSEHYQIISPEEVISYIRGEFTVSRPCAALSFDDGWADNYFYATPILAKRRLRAMLAVSAGMLYDAPVREQEDPEVLRVSSEEARKRAAAGDFRAYASIPELKAMHDSGVWRVEAHGTAHAKGRAGASVLAMPQNGESNDGFSARLHKDIGGCCDALEKITGVKPEMFFWPYGHYTSLAAECVNKMGLLQFTVAKGSVKCGERRILMPRIGVSPRWKKFRKNCFIFRHPLLTWFHDLFHKEKVCFDREINECESPEFCNTYSQK